MSVSKGLVSQFTAALAPAIEFVANSLTTFSQGLMASEGGARAFAINSATAFLEFASSALHNFEKFVNGVIIGFNMIIGAANLFSPVISGINFLFDALVEGIKGQINTIISFTQLIDKALERFGKKPIFNLEQFNLEPVTFALQTFEKIDRVDFSGTVNGLRGIADLVRETAEVATTAGEAIQTMAAPPSQFEAFIDRLKQSRTQADDLQDGLIKLANQGIDGLGKAFTNAITGAQKFSDAIRSMAKSVIDSLIQMLIQKYIVDAAFGFITNKIGNFQADRDFLGIEASDFSGRAMGGPVAGGRPYLVGERGPELMVPAGNGTVVPNNALGGGGVTVVQNINVTTGVQQTVRAEIANLLPQISNAAKSAVADARMRGGGFSKAMVGA